MKKAIFTLEALACPSCILQIEITLGQLEGIEEIDVMFYPARVRTEFDPAVIQASEIKETLENLGYPVLAEQVA